MNIKHVLEGCRRNDPRAQEMLYRSTASKMMAICLRYSASQFQAEEILQAGFIKVFSKIHLFAGKGSFEGWIRRIMVNTAIESCRKNVVLFNIDEVDEQKISDASAFETDQLEVLDLLNMIQELAPGYRLVFNMYVIEGFTHKEIAKTLHITESASKSQLSRARIKLQEKIKDMEGELNEIKL